MRLDARDQLFRPDLGLGQAVEADHDAHADRVQVGVEEAAAGDAAGAADHLDVQALVADQAEPFLDHLARQREGLLDAQGGVRRAGARQQPGLLGQERVHAIAGDHDPGADVASGPVGAHPGDPPVRVPQQTGGHRGGDQPGARRDRLAGQPGVEVGAVGGHPVVGRAVPGTGPVIDGHRLGRRHHHGGAPGHPPLYRHLGPPLRHDLVENPPVDDAAVDVLRAGEGPALEEDHIAARPGQLQCRGRPGGPGADDHRVDGDQFSRHGLLPPAVGPLPQAGPFP